MSAALHLADQGDLEKLLPMVTAFHRETGLATTEEARQSAIAPLLDGSPHGAIWLIGPRKSPVGYVAITFGWSIELGGLDGFVDEFFIRPSVRGRGMGTEALAALLGELRGSGLIALHLEVSRDSERSQRLYRRLGFRTREGYHLMSWRADGA